MVKPLQKYLTDELYATKKLTIRWVGGWVGVGVGKRTSRGSGTGEGGALCAVPSLGAGSVSRLCFLLSPHPQVRPLICP